MYTKSKWISSFEGLLYSIPDVSILRNMSFTFGQRPTFFPSISRSNLSTSSSHTQSFEERVRKISRTREISRGREWESIFSQIWRIRARFEERSNQMCDARLPPLLQYNKTVSHSDCLLPWWKERERRQHHDLQQRYLQVKRSFPAFKHFGERERAQERGFSYVSLSLSASFLKVFLAAAVALP